MTIPEQRAEHEQTHCHFNPTRSESGTHLGIRDLRDSAGAVAGLLEEAEELLAAYGVRCPPTITDLAEAERLLGDSGLHGPGLNDLLGRIRSARTAAAISRTQSFICCQRPPRVDVPEPRWVCRDAEQRGAELGC